MPSSTSTTAPTDADPCVREKAGTFDKSASLRPDPSIPTAGAMPAGTFLSTIQDNGVLVVGVDENTRYFSSRNPATGEFEGFEVALARKIAEAILGDRTRVRFVSVVTDEKVPFVHDDKVDMTISVVSASCDRWREVLVQHHVLRDQPACARTLRTPRSISPTTSPGGGCA